MAIQIDKIIIFPTCDAVPAWIRGVHQGDLRIHVHQTMIRPGHCLPENEKDNRRVADAVRLCTVSEKHDAVASIDQGNQG